MTTEDKADAGPEMVSVVNLDANGVYWGLLQIEKASVLPSHVVLPECDLAPGKYRWNAQGQHFEAMAVPLTAPETVTPERVLFDLVKFAQSLGATAPSLAEYIAMYQKSIDALGMVDGGGK